MSWITPNAPLVISQVDVMFASREFESPDMMVGTAGSIVMMRGKVIHSYGRSSWTRAMNRKTIGAPYITKRYSLKVIITFL